MKAAVGMGFGANASTQAAPDLPTEVRTTDVEQWRARMEEKRERRRAIALRQAAAAASAGVGRGDRVTPLDEAQVRDPGATPRPRPPRPTEPRPTEPRADRAPWTADNVTAMVAAYLAGASLKMLAEQSGWSMSTISTRLKNEGVHVRPTGAHTPRDLHTPRTPVVPPSLPPAAPSAPAPLSTPVPVEPPTVTDPAPAVPLEPAAVTPTNPGVPARERRTISSSELAEIVAAYTAGQSPPEIAATFGRTPATIRRAVARAGVPMRDDRVLRSGGTQKPDDPALVAQIRDLYAQGLTQAQVAERLGSGVHLVQGLMARNSIETRPDARGQARTATVPRKPPRTFDTAAHARSLAAAAARRPTTPPAGGEPNAPTTPVAATTATAPPTGGPDLNSLIADALAVPVLEVVAAARGVASATQALLDAQVAVANLRLHRLQALTAALLDVLATPEVDR